MDDRLDISEVTPDMAQKELARREMERRQLAKQSNSPNHLKDVDWETSLSDLNKNSSGVLADQLPASVKPVADVAAGHTQGLMNIPSGLLQLPVSGANALGANIPNVPRFNFAPKGAASEIGNALSYIGNPTGILKMLGSLSGLGHISRGAMGIPIVAKALQHAGNIIGKSPFASKVAGNALLGGAYAPDHPLLGMTLGGAAPALSELTNLGNPLINAGVRGTLGAAGGATLGGLTGTGMGHGALLGASAAVGLPFAAKALGIGAAKPGLETLEHLSESEVKPALEASNRLGTPITPAEASGNPFVGRQEGAYGRTGAAAAEKTRIGMERVTSQKKAVDNLLDTIYDRSKLSKQKISDLYTASFKSNLPKETVQSLKDDPVIAEAFNNVARDPAWQRKLKDVPEHNYAYLDKVKVAIGNEEERLIGAGESAKAAEYTDARNHLTKIMDTINPTYKTARQEAQKSITRSELQYALNTKEIKGTNFYNTVLRNENKFNDLMKKLKNVPEAQAKLRDMKLAWKNLINIEKPSGSAYREETGLNQSRQIVNKMLDIWTEMTGAKRNLKALKFIHSGEWDKSFKEVMKVKDKRGRDEKIAHLLGKVDSMGETQS